MTSFTLKVFIATSVVSSFVAAKPGVPRRECDTICIGGPHDRCVECASNCPKTCNRPNGPEACIALCKVNACECENGYVRAPDGKCVRPSQCPSNTTVSESKCPPCFGGRHDRCVPCASGCPATCHNLPDPAVDRICILSCQLNTCECKAGYVRDDNGICIRPESCPANSNTDDSDKGSDLENKKRNDDDSEGHGPVVRTDVLQCKKKCTGGPHDRCVSCGTHCPLTCEKPVLGFCTEDCVIDVCECEPGYIRAQNGQCVRPQQCPVKSS